MIEEFIENFANLAQSIKERDLLVEKFENELVHSRFYLDMYNMASYLFNRGESAAAEALWLFLTR